MEQGLLCNHQQIQFSYSLNQTLCNSFEGSLLQVSNDAVFQGDSHALLRNNTNYCPISLLTSITTYSFNVGFSWKVVNVLVHLEFKVWNWIVLLLRTLTCDQLIHWVYSTLHHSPEEICKICEVSYQKLITNQINYKYALRSMMFLYQRSTHCT
jgi:hypothetical protein